MRILFTNKGKLILLFYLLVSFFLFACASSNVSRTTATNVDMGIRNAKSLVTGAYNSDVVESYQNSSQAIKGAVIGGAAGGLAGMISAGIGVFPGIATGTLLGASYGAYIDSQANSEDKLENRGVSIVVLGDQILIVLRSARIFQPYTATVKPQAYSTLYLVAKYINRYVKMLVKVTGYANDTGSYTADLSLSNEQAQAVAKFLVASGLDARLLYAEGCGSTRLVDNTDAGWDGNDNYRIEITLEKLYV